jgi:hypothetical protein
MQAMPRDGSLVVIGSWLNKALFALMGRKDLAGVQHLNPDNFSVVL